MQRQNRGEMPQIRLISQQIGALLDGLVLEATLLLTRGLALDRRATTVLLFYSLQRISYIVGV